MLDAGDASAVVPYEQTLDPDRRQKRLIAHARTLYRPDDLARAGDALALLPLGQLESRRCPASATSSPSRPGSWRSRAWRSRRRRHARAEVGYVHAAGDGDWWVPSGRVFFSPARWTTARGGARRRARTHFFLPRRFGDPFHRAGFETERVVTYDAYDLLVLRNARSRLGNIVTAEQRLPRPAAAADDRSERQPHPKWPSTPSGMVVGTAVMGKVGEAVGDSARGFEPDLDEATVRRPSRRSARDPHALLQASHHATRLRPVRLPAHASTTRSRSQRSSTPWRARRMMSDLRGAMSRRALQHRLLVTPTASGARSRRKAQAEPGPLVAGRRRSAHAAGSAAAGRSSTTRASRSGSTSRSSAAPTASSSRAIEGVSPVLFYDPVGRVVATLHPNHTWEKVVFGAVAAGDLGRQRHRARPGSGGRPGRRRPTSAGSRTPSTCRRGTRRGRTARLARSSSAAALTPASTRPRQASHTWTRSAARS